MAVRDYIKHPTHYYIEDGDIILQAENTHFLVHKTFLSYASQFFKDLFTCAIPSSNETINVMNGCQSNESSIPIIEIPYEKSTSIEDILSFIYPNTILEIGWIKIENLLYLADKFIIKKLTYSCEIFLQNRFIDNPLTSFILADKYFLPFIFKESSKLILDDFIKYEADSNFKLISKKTQERLTYSRYLYYSKLDKFYNGYISSTLKNYMIFFDLTKICTYPIPKPSFVWNYIHHNDQDRDLVVKSFYTDFKEYIGTYEKLTNGPDGNCYPFIKLE